MVPRHPPRTHVYLTLLALLATIQAPLVQAHPADARYHAELDWRAEHIQRTLAVAWTLGMRGRGQGTVRDIDGRRCLEGPLLAFDVEDAFAFDIDGPVTVEVEVLAPQDAEILLAYDRSGAGDSKLTAKTQQALDSGSIALTFELAHARFAGRGAFGSDLAIGTADGQNVITLCRLALRRDPTPVPAATADFELQLRDAANGQLCAARVGLFDANGRTPLPGPEALLVETFSDQRRLVFVRPGNATWPAPRPHAFYVDGTYRMRLPPGRYHLVVSKGPEYRVEQVDVLLEANSRRQLSLALKRWRDLPADGWYSGDVHLHIDRRSSPNSAILAQMAAEDVHVASLLEMGNLHTTHFRQTAWGEASEARRDNYLLVPGQEDPRLSHRGHALALHLQRPVRDPQRYFLYHEVFEQVRRQGGVTGYAHLAGEWFGAERGLAIDVPFSLVDVLEILQFGRCNTEAWYRFLNLGFELAPAAGSDFPYLDLPGAVRTYVWVDGELTSGAWFDGLAAGRSFVTDGPMLRFEVNGFGPGTRLELATGDPLIIRAVAEINPDLGQIEGIELIVHGDQAREVRAEDGAETLRLEHRLQAEEGLWLAVRANGRSRSGGTLVAHSAPVYVRLAGGRFWKTATVGASIEHLHGLLAELTETPLDTDAEIEWWETAAKLAERWPRQRPLLQQRAAAAAARYDALLSELRASKEDNP